VTLGSCVTFVDNALPYTRLPEITIASPIQLVASPSHPTSYLTSDPIPAGSKVQVIGADENQAWLLVLHDELLGWMPAFIAGTGIATLTPAVAFRPMTGECTQYLGATFDPDEEWVSSTGGAVYVLGSIYRPRAGKRFDEATLTLDVSGRGVVVQSDYVHTPLTASSAAVFFGFSLRDLRGGSRISFDVANPGKEAFIFQAAHFTNECASRWERLPIGVIRTPDQEQIVSPDTQPPSATGEAPTPTPIVISSGPPSAHEFDIALTLCKDNCDIYLKKAGEIRDANDVMELVQLTTDPAYDNAVAWAPDGKQFVFASDRSGSLQLYIFDIDRKRVIRQITNSSNYKTHPAWSPDGQEIVYQEWMEAEGEWHLWKVNLKTLERRRLTRIGTNKTPRWSPQGDRIVFSAARRDTNDDGVIDDNDARHIWITDRNGNSVRSVTNETYYYDWNPFWMPDGQHIVFSRHVKGNTVGENGPGEIYIASLETGTLTPLTFTSADESAAIPSPGGDQFLIVSKKKDEDSYKMYLANWDGDLLGELAFIAETDWALWRPSSEEE